MASRSVLVEWYQSETRVTASVKLKGVPSDVTITAKFESQRCAIHIGDAVYWESYLTNAIVPERSYMKVGRVRGELKMKKADPLHWSDFEAIAPVTASGPETDPSSSNTSSSTLPPTAAPLVSTPSSSGPSHLLASATAVPSHEKNHPPSTKPFTSTQSDFVYVNHLRHDWVDTGSEEVWVKVMVGGVKKGTCSANFKEGQFELQFQTTDARFLKSYTGSSQTCFVWKVQLFDTIVPSACRYDVTQRRVDIVLKKTSSEKWRALEQSQHHSSLTSSSLNSNLNSTNEVTRKAPSTNRNADPSSNSSDSEVNDLDEEDDSSATKPVQPTPPQNVTDRQSTPLSSPSPSIASTRKTGQTSSSHDGNQSTPTSSRSVSEPQLLGGGGSVQNFTATPHQNSPRSSGTVQVPPTSSQANLPPTRLPPSQLETSDPNYQYEQLRRPSLTGLTNQGNTCFMNSTLQCLSNTPVLRDYFVSGRYLANINKENPLGFQGELAKCFSGILRKLWSGEFQYFPPKKLIEIIAKRSKHFDGHSQHDAQEFMSYLIDGLHEDLNRVLKKPTTQPVEMEGCPDREMAAESWKVFKMRNDSMMVDLFQGQFKSTLVCPNCNKESVTFDPFMSMSVPIPKNLRRLPVIFVPQDPDCIPRQLILQLPEEATLQLLKASVARRRSLSMTQLRVFEAYKGKFQNLLSDNQRPISAIKENDIIIVSEVLSERGAQDRGPVVEINVIQRVQIALFPTKCAFCGDEAKEGKKLQRCGTCKAVGYCDRVCQGKDWNEHRMNCRRAKPVPVGLPFVISLPASQLTYARLTECAEKFASHSVTVTRRDPVSPPSMQGSAESMQGSAENMQGSAENMQGSAENMQGSAENMQGSAGSMQGSAESMQGSAESMQSTKSLQSSSLSMQGCTDISTMDAHRSMESRENSGQDIQGSTESVAVSADDSILESAKSMQESTESIQENPKYILIRVNRYRDSIPGEEPLEDHGQSPLVFEDKVVYLAMDWRNNPKEKDSVVVTPKETMDYMEDEEEGSLSPDTDTISLTQCLQLFTEPENLSKEEAWYCPRCKEHREATKQMSVWRLPRLLIIHLKRFSFHNYVWRSKIDHHVSFPLYGLNMSSYLLGDAANDIPPETPPIYDLYATVNHYGNVYIGHYVAYVKPPQSHETRDKKEWLCYDDNKIWKVDEDQVPCSNAYVLFYRHRNATPLP